VYRSDGAEVTPIDRMCAQGDAAGVVVVLWPASSKQNHVHELHAHKRAHVGSTLPRPRTGPPIMPYLVALEVKESPVGGSGLFAMQDIPAGTKTWVMRPKGDDVAKVGRMPVPSRHSA
jgi:hypothetical protein